MAETKGGNPDVFMYRQPCFHTEELTNLRAEVARLKGEVERLEGVEGALLAAMREALMRPDRWREAIVTAVNDLGRGIGKQPCICAEFDGKGLSTCGMPCPVHGMREA